MQSLHWNFSPRSWSLFLMLTSLVQLVCLISLSFCLLSKNQSSKRCYLRRLLLWSKMTGIRVFQHLNSFLSWIRLRLRLNSSWSHEYKIFKLRFQSKIPVKPSWICKLNIYKQRSKKILSCSMWWSKRLMSRSSSLRFSSNSCIRFNRISKTQWHTVIWSK